MTQKVATERRIKSRQETTSLCQIATVTVKLRISDKEQWFGLFITSPECREEGNFRQFFSVRTHVNFTRVNKIEAMNERPRVNVRVERGSTFTFMRGLSYIASIFLRA